MPNNYEQAARPDMEDRGEIDIASLTRLSLFGRLDVERNGELLTRCTKREAEAGEIILQRGVANDRIYVILEGRLSIHLQEDDAALAILREGETVGEMSIIGDQPTSAIVKAETRALLLEIPREAFWGLIERDPSFARQLLELFAKRLLNVTNVVFYSRQMQEKYRREAYADPLTDLYNQRWLNETLPFEMSRCVVCNRPLSLIAVTVDDFGGYNAAWGHSMADQALRELATAIQIELRTLDMAARREGAEIMAVLPGADANEAERVAHRLHSAANRICDPARNSDPLPKFTVSIGIGEMVSGDYGEMLIARSSAAVGRARDLGGGATSR
ncbi:MAG: diguanylate cyclase [Pseudomonadota bacterium]|nr:diguanylate cyclase [Pseudomonadota bacterium]